MDDQFEKWVDLWAKAQDKWATEPVQPKQPKPVDNFFGLQTHQVPEEGTASNDDGDSWRSIYDRSSEIRQESPVGDMLFHEQAEGWRDLLSPPGKDVKFFHNPQHQASIGMDQGKSPYEPTRVAPNFTDGKELRELSDLKEKLEKLESTLLGNEIKAGKANTPVGSYKDQLDKLRQQMDDLSNKLTPEPGRDVY
jgi:hypothetical protein